MVKKNPASDLKMKIYNECKGEIYIYIYIYIDKKSEDQPCHTNWKKSKDTQLVGQKKKTPLGRLSYNVKSAQYWVEQNSSNNYLVSRELICYSFT